jgi:hypothetical protein
MPLRRRLRAIGREGEAPLPARRSAGTRKQDEPPRLLSARRRPQWGPLALAHRLDDFERCDMVEIAGGGRDRAVPELLRDDRDVHAFAAQLDGVGMAQAVRVSAAVSLSSGIRAPPMGWSRSPRSIPTAGDKKRPRRSTTNGGKTMLLRRYKHGHGLLLGIVIGLFLAGHALWLFLAGVTVSSSIEKCRSVAIEKCRSTPSWEAVCGDLRPGCDRRGRRE